MVSTEKQGGTNRNIVEVVNLNNVSSMNSAYSKTYLTEAGHCCVAMASWLHCR